MRGIKKNTKGSSLVSVIVAFAILMIAIAMLSTAMAASMNLMARARRNDRQTSKLLETFYGSYAGNAAGTVSGTIILSRGSDSIAINGQLASKEVKDTEAEEGETFYYYIHPQSVSQNPAGE
ncbi:MAG: hypothetical protein PHE06_12140 [Lachnospiraceae bacterium]|nr:hypothetical protein [Lachnospiraceae bacterium]